MVKKKKKNCSTSSLFCSFSNSISKILRSFVHFLSSRSGAHVMFSLQTLVLPSPSWSRLACVWHHIRSRSRQLMTSPRGLFKAPGKRKSGLLSQISWGLARSLARSYSDWRGEFTQQPKKNETRVKYEVHRAVMWVVYKKSPRGELTLQLTFLHQLGEATDSWRLANSTAVIGTNYAFGGGNKHVNKKKMEFS